MATAASDDSSSHSYRLTNTKEDVMASISPLIIQAIDGMGPTPRRARHGRKTVRTRLGIRPRRGR